MSQDKRLLIVEDDDAIRESITDLLSLEGYQVTESKNGKEALQLLKGWEPDLVISDVMMPEMDGHTLLTEYHNLPNSKNIPFLFLTALTDKTSIRKGMNLGADDYLTKPFARHDLINSIEVQINKFSRRSQKLNQLVEKKFEQEKEVLNEEKESILVELHHRVKHNLAVISSFFELGEMSNDDEFIKSIKSRVHAIAKIQEVAYQEGLTSEVNGKELIQNLLLQLPKNDQIFVTGTSEEFLILTEKATSLGLLITDLIDIIDRKKDDEKQLRIHVNGYYDKNDICIDFTVNSKKAYDIEFEDFGIQGTLLNCYFDQLSASMERELSNNKSTYKLKFPNN